MKYTFDVEVNGFIEVTVEAEDKEQAEQSARDKALKSDVASLRWKKLEVTELGAD